jgi:hypothetical protein
MTDNELKDVLAKFAAENAAGFAALREAQAKTEAQIANTDAKYANTIEMLNGITESQGLVAEEFFYNSLADALKVGGVQYDGITTNVKRKANGKQVEIDLLLDNGSSIAIIEVKYRARAKNVEQLQKTIATYRELFPQHKDFKIYGGIASFNVDDVVTAHAHEQGFFVLKRKGELMDVDTQGMRAF